jgi:hypothetical protein
MIWPRAASASLTKVKNCGPVDAGKGWSPRCNQAPGGVFCGQWRHFFRAPLRRQSAVYHGISRKLRPDFRATQSPDRKILVMNTE